MWYTAFTSCPDARRDGAGRFVDCGSGRRAVAMLYANSSDGLVWDKPALPGAPCFDPAEANKGGQPISTAACAKPGAMRTNVAFPDVIGTGVFKDPIASPAERFKVIGAGVAGGRGLGSGGVCSGPDGLRWGTGR